MKSITFGIIITNRSFFPSHLVTEARNVLLKQLERLHYNSVMLSDSDTPLGAVMTLSDVEKCIKLFQEKQPAIDGVIVILPNFGEESAVADVLQFSKLNVPVLVQACDDSVGKMDLANRRDAFCGKISVCSNLYQRNIKFTNTTTHTCELDSAQFTKDLEYFASVCRVVGGLSTARIGAIGTRPNAFHTVRYSEKLLQKYGITVSTADLSDIMATAESHPDNAPDVMRKIQEIRSYGKIASDISNEKVVRQAKLCITIENWMTEHKCNASAISCWDSIQNHYGCATCLAMSMMGEKGLPSACEMDVMGAVTMYAMYLASGEPSGYLDWNNSFTEDRDKCVCLHCSNFPKSFFKTKFEISNLDVLATTIGAEKCFGACKAQIAGGSMTFAKISTDDFGGKIKVYLGNGEILDDPVDTKGGVALCHIKDLQKLMNFICKNGFEHHVAMNRSQIVPVLDEAFSNYFGWDVYRHN